jgi:predicted dehydrogenase
LRFASRSRDSVDRYTAMVEKLYQTSNPFKKRLDTRLQAEGYESVIRSSIVDAVYIPLPNSEHCRWIEQALRS